MSKKTLVTIEKNDQVEVIDGRAVPYWKRALNEDGSEKLNPVSLVATVHLKPLSIGERIQRYLNTPSVADLQGSDYGYDDLDDMDDDPNVDPISPHEQRAYELQERSYSRRREEALAKAEADRLKEKERKEAFRRDYEALRADASEIPGSPPLTTKTEA